MIECRIVKNNDICISAFMFGMTMFTIIGCLCGKAAMKTGFIVQVVADIFVIMTLYAEFSLTVFVRCVMALITLLFIFFMRLGYRAWHQHRGKRVSINIC